MSGICAVLRLDGQAAGDDEFAPVLATLARRGPDGAALMADGPAALGHALLVTTPEALTEPMPFRHAPTGCVITADVRLDNRAELITALGIDAAGRVIGDGELTLLAYLRWGTDCLTQLLGDFAFALWDPRHQRLFVARDKVGMRQLIYHHTPGKLFACATDADALIRHRDVPHRINEARIADFIEQLEAIDFTSTFFDEVFRLPPAHALVVESGALRQWRYWALTPSPIIYRACDADYEAAFLDVFTEAVRARLRSPDPVGSMLSGGMDSGSVTATAALLLREAGAPPLQTFSGVDDNPACKESACIHDAAGHIAHISPKVISLADSEMFREAIIRLTIDECDPFDGHMTLIRAIYHAARQAGIKVMLDGVSGDTTLGTGDIVAYHLGNGRLLTAWAEARGMERMWGAEAPALTGFAKAVRRRLAPGWVRARRIAAWQAAEAAQAAEESLVSDALAARVDMPARRRAFAQHVAIDAGCDQASQVQRMLHPYAIAGRERYDRVAGAIGIEPRDPFLDVRLLEFVVSLPIEQLHGGGWPKLILRRAIGTMLPASVRWKRVRDHVGWRFTEVCIDDGLRELKETNSSQLRSYVKSAISRNESALRCNSDGVVSETDLLYLNFWMTRFKSAEV
jgi:asparagine synthase (glutamine-hydrolysing)